MLSDEAKRKLLSVSTGPDALDTFTQSLSSGNNDHFDLREFDGRCGLRQLVD